ncbi:hypothetical protein LMG27952_02426 [Paraburkholderia hiiakae]|uniref:Uncharacterized protein n=1 Tax=Paraburkholderia hiiakae TaxID=1081782 RepID=A0ABM8NKK5_9BURK|nr:hypothetical protein LMG27952_02426 [Paraburkholderia hiiakae]
MTSLADSTALSTVRNSALCGVTSGSHAAGLVMSEVE